MPKKDFSNLDRVNGPLQNIIGKVTPPPTAPAAAFVPPPQYEPEKPKHPRAGKAQIRYTADIDRYEPRTKRFQLLMKPSVFENARRIAAAKRQSVNNYIESLMEADIARERAEYEQNREQKRMQGKG